MRALSVANDIVPIAEFKTNIASWFKNLQQSGHPLIITQNSKPAGVLLSPHDYDALMYRKTFLDSVERGMIDASNEKVYSTEDLKAELAKRRTV
ncbi:type II toxin-antitoxin system Phd/YefM family antitoxin [bacterium]|nr:type II toxin-antitoxin system Phd/YefM family antitoxin [bacterium]